MKKVLARWYFLQNFGAESDATVPYIYMYNRCTGGSLLS